MQAREEWREFNPCKFILVCVLTQIFLIALATASFLKDSDSLAANSADIKMYQSNMEHIKGCQKFVYDNAYHNRMFRTCGTTTFNLASMVFFILRDRVGLARFGYSYEIQEHSNLNKKRTKICMI